MVGYSRKFLVQMAVISLYSTIAEAQWRLSVLKLAKTSHCKEYKTIFLTLEMRMKKRNHVSVLDVLLKTPA